MNYLKTYIQICRRSESRQLSKNDSVERHHVFPTSIYGENGRIVNLTPREHVLVHWLLYKEFNKRYGISSEKTKKDVYGISLDDLRQRVYQ